jgi:hypothetical protein
MRLEALPGRMRLLCGYAQKLTVAPWETTEADVLALREGDLSDRDIVDANQVVAYFNYDNRVAEGWGSSWRTTGRPTPGGPAPTAPDGGRSRAIWDRQLRWLDLEAPAGMPSRGVRTASHVAGCPRCRIDLTEPYRRPAIAFGITTGTGQFTVRPSAGPGDRQRLVRLGDFHPENPDIRAG